MSFDLTDPIFHDEDAARAYFEAIRWPDGKPICPHCGVVGRGDPRSGQVAPPRHVSVQRLPEPFTVTVGSVMEVQPCPAAQVGAGVPLDGGEQERRLGPPAYADAWPRLLSHRLVHGASRSRGDGRSRPGAAWAARERRSKLTKHSSASPTDVSFPARAGRASAARRPSAKC